MDHVSHTVKQKAQRWCKGWNLSLLLVVAGGQITAQDVENFPPNLHCIAQGEGWPRVSTALRVLPLCTYRNKKSNRSTTGRAEPEPLAGEVPPEQGLPLPSRPPPPARLSRTGRTAVLGLPAASCAAGAGLMQRLAERPAGCAGDRGDGCEGSVGPTRPQAHFSSSWHSLSPMARSLALPGTARSHQGPRWDVSTPCLKLGPSSVQARSSRLPLSHLPA